MTQARSVRCQQAGRDSDSVPRRQSARQAITTPFGLPQAVASSRAPSSSVVRARMMNF